MMKKPTQLLSLVFVFSAFGVLGAGDKPVRKGGGSSQPVQTSKCNEVPAHPFDLILGRPTTASVTVSVLCYDDAEGGIAYGNEGGKLALKTPVRRFKKGEPAEIVLPGLQPDRRYIYQLRLGHSQSAEIGFHTARPPGSGFRFTITADSHLDEHTEPAIYQQTLAGAVAAKPDFHIDLGDTFMAEKHVDREAAAKQYLAQRYFLGPLCQSAPLFCVLGNHDGESPRGRGGAADSLAVWSNTMRKRYFPNPVPDAFYSGDAAQHPEVGLLQDYYPGNGKAPRSAAEYGYKSGMILGSSGHLRVTVSPAAAVVEYLRSGEAGATSGGRMAEAVAQTYTIPAL